MANHLVTSSNSDISDDLEMQDVDMREDQSHSLLTRKEESRRRSSEDDFELQQRLDLKGETEGQTQTLLAPYRDDDRIADDDQKVRVEWHIRTPWAIAGSVAAAAIMFIAMVLFARFIIVQETVKVEQPQLKHNEGFRRPSSDYIIDPAWDFDASPRVRSYKWTIGDIVANPDGVFRPMIAINGQFPGPMIECNEGDTLIIEVDNQSINATSIHFHGLYQNGTNWMDGTSGITQCPIAPGGRFTYKFKVSGQSGTYYYHGHQAIQASDGLVGPLVIHGRQERKLETLEYSSDRVVMVQDYYHDLSSALLYETLMPGNEASPIPNGALINGRNIRDCSAIKGRTCNNATAGLPSFNLASDKSHKLRFINVGAFAWFQVELDDHELAIVEVDGTQIVPSYRNSVMIGTAQRYSVVIKADKTSASSFWLRARMVTTCFSNWRLPGAPANEARAVVSYTSKQGALVSPPSFEKSGQHMEGQCRDTPMTSLIPADPISAPPLGKTYYIRSNLAIGDWRLERGFFNKSSFRPQLDKPSLHRTIDGLRTNNASFNAALSGTNEVAFEYKREFVIQHHGIQTVDLIIQNFDEGNHPMHLHGHKSWVLGQGHAYFPGYESLDQEYLKNPIRRDVASVEGYGWLLIRFVTDNPGMWAFHCHMAWHSESGLLMQFMNRPEVMQTWEIPEANAKLCEAPIEALEKGAAPKDDIWFGYGLSRPGGKKGQ